MSCKCRSCSKIEGSIKDAIPWVEKQFKPNLSPMEIFLSKPKANRKKKHELDKLKAQGLGEG